VLPGVGQRFRGCVPAVLKAVQRSQRAAEPRPGLRHEALERRLIITGFARHRRHGRFRTTCSVHVTAAPLESPIYLDQRSSQRNHMAEALFCPIPVPPPAGASARGTHGTGEGAGRMAMGSAGQTAQRARLWGCPGQLAPIAASTTIRLVADASVPCSAMAVTGFPGGTSI